MTIKHVSQTLCVHSFAHRAPSTCMVGWRCCKLGWGYDGELQQCERSPFVAHMWGRYIGQGWGQSRTHTHKQTGGRKNTQVTQGMNHGRQKMGDLKLSHVDRYAVNASVLGGRATV